MAKREVAKVKLQLPAGKATPAPPVGPALGQAGCNIPEFCKQFNARTASMGDYIIPVVITVYSDKSFVFITKTPPASDLLKKAAGLKGGSGTPNKTKAGSITHAKVRELAAQKLSDLNAYDVDAAVKILEGTARSMGLDIID